jgi:hypothetical protein
MGAVRNAYKIIVIILKHCCEDLHITYLPNNESQARVVKAETFVFTTMFQEN